MQTIRIDTGCAVDRYADLNVVRTPDDLAVLRQWMSERSGQVLAIDCETNAEDAWDPAYRLRLTQIADEQTTWVVVSEDLPASATRDLVRGHRWWVAQYSEMEVKFLERHAPGTWRFGEAIPHVVDLQVLNAYYEPRTVTSRTPGVDPRIPLPRGLKDRATRELSPVLADTEKAMHERFHEIAPKGFRVGEKMRKWGFANIPNDDSIYLTYSGLDPLMTLRLYKKAEKVVRARGQWSIVESDSKLQWQIDQMTFRGLKVDGNYAKWLDEQLSTVIDEAAEWLASYDVKPTGMGPQVGTAFESLGITSSKTTDGGKSSWDKAVITELLDHEREDVRQLAATVNHVRKATKFRSAYIEPMLTALTRDGRVHCSMRAIGATTGRNTARDPALQQLPKKDTRVRAAYEADPGYVIVSCDMSQGEPRTMAALSQDKAYLAALVAGDINNAVAAEAFGEAFIPADGKKAGTASYLMRQGGKAGFLAKCYGAGVTRLAGTLGVPIDHARMVARRWEDAYPRLWALADQLNSQSEVHLESGRVCPLWDRYMVTETGELRIWPQDSRKGLNYATQGTQRDLLARAIHQLVTEGWGEFLWFIVHDEILLHVPEWAANAAVAALTRAMTFVYKGVPFECEATIEGRTWLPQPDDFDPAELAAVDGAEFHGSRLDDRVELLPT